MDKSVQKQKLRKELLKYRKNIPEEEYYQKSVQICRRVVELPEFKRAHTIHCYISINERREVNTHPLIKQILEEDREVIVPIAQIKTKTLRNVRLDNFSDLKTNRWGVLEPAGGAEIAAENIDLVIVPMAGGDTGKNRIGYGKGFYDRFLPQVDCPKIGLLFERCLVENLPVEPFDVPLDMVVTESRIIR